MNTEPHLYQVGQLYHPDRTRWPERPEYNFRGGQHELKLFLNRPTAEEIASVTSGHAHFAFDVEGDAIFFLYRFEPAIPWGDSTFSLHLVPEVERVVPEPDDNPEARALITTLLIDAETGILKVIRALSFSPDFTRRLHAAIREQAAQPFNAQHHERNAAAVMARLQTTDLLKRAVAKCRGGA